MKRALITGVTGQDGSYLTELLLDLGYEVHGTSRDLAGPAALRYQEILSHRSDRDRALLYQADLLEPDRIVGLIHAIEPDEVYNLAAQSHVGRSFECPEETFRANAEGALRLLEAIRELSPRRTIRFYQASSSEVFGAAKTSPQSESTPFHPCNPYAVSKVAAFHQVVHYREAYGVFACNGILYNHESPRRTPDYVTRKITFAAARIAAGLQSSLRLGNLQTGRDWGYAREYVEAMWRMMQHREPDDFVIATGVWHSLGDLLDVAFRRVNLDWRNHVETDPNLIRPTEVGRLLGDPSKARDLLGWTAQTRFEDLVNLMVDADVERASVESAQPAAAVSAS